MYALEPRMFYKTMDAYMEEAKMIEKQKELMYSYLPEEYRQMQKKAEEACDRMEYAGSRMYDEHPDKDALRHMARGLLEFAKRDRYHEDMMYCFLCNEIFFRRCQMWKRQKYIR